MLKRQGELLFIPTDVIPANATAQKRNGPLVLARGREGNTHRFEGPGLLFAVPNDPATLFVDLPEGGTLVHGDGVNGHASIKFDAGKYQVNLHQEWSAAGNRVVED